MKSARSWIRRYWLQRCLHRTLRTLCDLVSHYDFAGYQHDKEIGDEVARKLKRCRRRARVFGMALERFNLKTTERKA